MSSLSLNNNAYIIDHDRVDTPVHQSSAGRIFIVLRNCITSVNETTIECHFHNMNYDNTGVYKLMGLPTL